jgi:hypothetical protein
VLAGATISMAGWVAEIEWFGNSVGGISTFRTINAKLARLAQESQHTMPLVQAEEFKLKVYRRARMIVRQHHKLIEALVDRLFMQRQLSSDEIDAIISEKPINPKFSSATSCHGPDHPSSFRP